MIQNKFLYNSSLELLIIHDWSGIILEVLTFLHLVLHWKWIKETTKKIFKRIKLRKSLKYFGLIIIIISLIVIGNLIATNSINDRSNSETIQIAGLYGTREYDPDLIETVRPDIFTVGYFSIFDILVYLNDINNIDMKYYFDESMDTYVIDSINGEENFWYKAYYDGGWDESNVYRMDHYPYKPNMVINIIKSTPEHLNSIYATFREEVTRLNNNDQSVIIPEITINSPNNNLKFENVEVTAHNLRNDIFQDGVITAIDVILSLGDQGLIDYELNWYETIGVSTVKSYYIDRINNDITIGRCGFVYEAGDRDFDNFRGNHIHIPADIRVITSPEYEKWFWICA
jgi:hypothetical protein